MATHTDPPKASGAKPVGKDDLQTLPLPEVEKRLNSSPNGLTSRGGEDTADEIRRQRNSGKEDQRAAKIPRLLLGPDSLDDRSRGGFVRHRSPLARLLHHSRAAARQRDHRLLGRARSRQRDRRLEGAARNQGAGEARRKMDHAAGERPSSRRRDPPASGRHRARRRPSARWRRDLRGSIGADRRVASGVAQSRRRSVLRFDHPARRGRRAGLRDGRQDLFRQDGGTGRDGGHGQSFPEGRAEDRRLSHRARVDHGGRDRGAVDLSRRSHSLHPAIRAGPDRRRHSRGDAHGAVGDDGGGRAQAGEKAGDRQQAGCDRGTGRRGCAVRRQDGHADAEQADARSALLPRQNHARRTHPGRRARLATGERRHHRSGRAGRPEGQGRAEALSGHAFHAVRSGAQAHRGDGEGRGRQDLQGRPRGRRRSSWPSRPTPQRSRTPSTRPSTISRREGFARSASRGRMATGNGDCSGCCLSSILRAKTPRRPSRPPPKWA